MRTTLILTTEPLARARHCHGRPGAIALDSISRALEPEEVLKVRNGARVFATQPDATGVPDLELVNRLRDQDP